MLFPLADVVSYQFLSIIDTASDGMGGYYLAFPFCLLMSRTETLPEGIQQSSWVHEEEGHRSGQSRETGNA